MCVRASQQLTTASLRVLASCPYSHSALRESITATIPLPILSVRLEIAESIRATLNLQFQSVQVWEEVLAPQIAPSETKTRSSASNRTDRQSKQIFPMSCVSPQVRVSLHPSVTWIETSCKVPISIRIWKLRRMTWGPRISKFNNYRMPSEPFLRNSNYSKTLTVKES